LERDDLRVLLQHGVGVEFRFAWFGLASMSMLLPRLMLAAYTRLVSLRKNLKAIPDALWSPGHSSADDQQSA
jgi:hypothetical protein